MTAVQAVRDLARDARAALTDIERVQALARAWTLLQERDRDGQPSGPLPYTDAAITELRAAQDADHDDVGVVHHLAIATHARAWDWELAGDRRAAGEWGRALGYWRIVASSGPFWAQMAERLRAAGADPALAAVIRRDLLEHLLDIHVAFVRHYCDSDAPDKAALHVDLVRRAQIPPAIKSRLVERIYTAMTGSLADALARQEHLSALDTLERFLTIFPDWLPALRRHAEVTRARLSVLSYRDHWDDVAALGARARPWASSLAAHADLNTDPLAGPALEEEAAEFAQKALDRACGFKLHTGERIPVRDRDAGYAALEFGLDWARLAYPRSPGGSRVRAVVGNSAALYGLVLRGEAFEIDSQPGLNDRDRRRAVGRLLRRAIALVQEAALAFPEEPEIANLLDELRMDLARYEGAN